MHLHAPLNFVMTAKELRMELARRTGLPAPVIHLILHTLCDVIAEKIKAGEKVDLENIIRLECTRRTFNIRHQKTGERSAITKVVLLARAKHKLKEFLNGKIRSLH